MTMAITGLGTSYSGLTSSNGSYSNPQKKDFNRSIFEGQFSAPKNDNIDISNYLETSNVKYTLPGVSDQPIAAPKTTTAKKDNSNPFTLGNANPFAPSVSNSSTNTASNGFLALTSAN